MTKKNRTILLISVAILFFLITPLIILYSQGYRFDFETKKFFQTGAFSFKVWPQGAWVFLDNKLTKKTDFLFGTIYIDNLLPKKYRVKIKKEGYLIWEKTLEIKEKWVTDNKNIFLVPENPQFNSLKEGVGSFFLSPDGKKAILKKNEEENWALILLNLEKNISSPLFEKGDFSEKDETVNFIKLNWSSDSRKFLLETTAGENKYFIVEINGESNIFPLNFLKINFTDVSFGPRDSQIIFLTQNLMEGSNLFTIDYKEKSLSGPILNNFLTFEIFNNSLFWLDDKGYLHQSDLSGREIGLLNREPFALDLNSQLQLIIFSENKIFLKTEGKLYFFDQGSQLFDKVSEEVREVKISPDSKKVVYFTDHEIWLLFLEKIEEQPQREKGEKIFLARFSEKIEDVFWYTSHYLIFSVSDKVKTAEIDNRDKVNIYDLTGFSSPEIFWNQYDKKLYILSQRNLFSSEKLLP